MVVKSRFRVVVRRLALVFFLFPAGGITAAALEPDGTSEATVADFVDPNDPSNESAIPEPVPTVSTEDDATILLPSPSQTVALPEPAPMLLPDDATQPLSTPFAGEPLEERDETTTVPYGDPMSVSLLPPFFETALELSLPPLESPVIDFGAPVPEGERSRFSAVGRVEARGVKYGTGFVAGCSNVVITAAHNLKEGARDLVSEGLVDFVDFEGNSHRVSGVRFRSARSLDNENDLAVITLERVLPERIVPAKLSRRDIEPVRPATIIGYGWDRVEASGASLRIGIGKVLGTSGRYMSSSLDGTSTGPAALLFVAPGPGNERGNFGDSGSPVIRTYEEAADDEVAGLLSGSIESPSMGIYVPMNLHSAWLESTIRDLCGTSIRLFQTHQRDDNRENTPANSAVRGWTSVHVVNTARLARAERFDAVLDCHRLGSRLPTAAEARSIHEQVRADLTSARWQRDVPWIWTIDRTASAEHPYTAHDFVSGGSVFANGSSTFHYICVW